MIKHYKLKRINEVMKNESFVRCSVGSKEKCINASTRRSECECACGGKNHGALRTSRAVKQLSLFASLNDKEKTQTGFITGFVATREVFIHKKELKPTRSFRIRRHSPDGFAWGYTGSGPAQLALALLLELCDREVAKRFYQDFKREVIAGLDKDRDFKIPTGLVQEFISKKQYLYK